MFPFYTYDSWLQQPYDVDDNDPDHYPEFYDVLDQISKWEGSLEDYQGESDALQEFINHPDNDIEKFLCQNMLDLNNQIISLIQNYLDYLEDEKDAYTKQF